MADIFKESGDKYFLQTEQFNTVFRFPSQSFTANIIKNIIVKSFNNFCIVTYTAFDITTSYPRTLNADDMYINAIIKIQSGGQDRVTSIHTFNLMANGSHDDHPGPIPSAILSSSGLYYPRKFIGVFVKKGDIISVDVISSLTQSFAGIVSFGYTLE